MNKGVVLGNLVLIMLLIAASQTYASIPKINDFALTRKGMFLWQGDNITGGSIIERGGFEIGNGKILIKNYPGKYILKMYDKWEVGILDKFTEVISPLYEGVPRARLQINVLEDEKIQTIQDLTRDISDSEWSKTFLGSLEGIKKDTALSNGVHQIELRLLRKNGEIIIITVDGKPSSDNQSAFDKLVSELESFQPAIF